MALKMKKIHIIYKGLKKERCGIKDYCLLLADALEKSGCVVNILSSFPNNEDLDILHLQYEPGVYKGEIKRLLPIFLKKGILCVTFHTLYTFGFRYLPIRFPFYMKSFLNLFILSVLSKGIIVTNEKSELFVKRFLPWAQHKVLKIPVGTNIQPVDIPENEKDKIRKDLNINREDIVLSHFGLFYKGKGLETLFKAIRILKVKNIYLKLLLLGTVRQESESYHRYLLSLAEKLNINNHLYWFYSLSEEEVSKYLICSDIYVVPYDKEGASTRRTSLMVGFAHSLPLISTKGKIVSHLFKNGQNIVLVPPKNAQKLAEAIYELAISSKKREKLQKELQELSKEFSWKNIAQKHIDFYRRFVR